jgi:hypothetical protein
LISVFLNTKGGYIFNTPPPTPAGLFSNLYATMSALNATSEYIINEKDEEMENLAARAMENAHMEEEMMN